MPPVAQGEPPLLARASQLLAQVRQQAMEAESKALALEQSTQPLALQLAQARQLLAQHELEQLRKRRERIETTLNEQRLAEAEAASLRAGQSAVSESHPALKRLAEANHEWADRLAETTQLLSDITRQRDEATRRTEAMRQDMVTLRQRLDQLGLGPVIGNLLLEKRSSLPTEAALARRIKDNRAMVGDIQLLDLDVANARAALSAPQTLASQLLIDVPAEEQAALEPAIQRLILVGGPMNMPLIRRVIGEELRDSPAVEDLRRVFDENPSHQLAQGRVGLTDHGRRMSSQQPAAAVQ